jgi:hypothetical protein
VIYRPGQGEGVPLSFEDSVSYDMLDCHDHGQRPVVQSNILLDMSVSPSLRAVSSGGAHSMVALFAAQLAPALVSFALTVRFRRELVVRASAVPFALAIVADIALEFGNGIASPSTRSLAWPSARCCSATCASPRAAQMAAGQPSLERVTYGSELVHERSDEVAAPWSALHVAYRAAVMLAVLSFWSCSGRTRMRSTP